MNLSYVENKTTSVFHIQDLDDCVHERGLIPPWASNYHRILFSNPGLLQSQVLL